MSIIQEALKKIQYNIETHQKPQQKDKIDDTIFLKKPINLTQKTMSHGNNFKLTISLFIIFIILAGLAVKQLLIDRKTDKKIKMPAETYVRSPSSYQEVIYKSISKAEIKSEQKNANLGQIAGQIIETNLKHPDLSLNGIMYLEDGPRAIINNSIVEVGNTVAGATVTRIDRKSVALESNGVEITLNLK